MIVLRDRAGRGRTQTDWLDSRHSFNFGTYYDSGQKGFRSLRVINDDRIAQGAGFPTHSHRDMEILTYMLDGCLEHKDSVGNGAILRPGDVQRMSAGTGIAHSEFNPSETEPAHLLQIWILPDRKGLPPSYEQKTFPVEERRGRLGLFASPDGRSGSLRLHQDDFVFAADLVPGERVIHELGAGRGAWLQIARGAAALNGLDMQAGDGAAIEGEPAVGVEAQTDVEFLLFDLA